MTTSQTPTPDGGAFLPIRTRMHHHVLELAIERHLKNSEAAKGTVSATGAATHDLQEVIAICHELKRDVAAQLDAFGPPARPDVDATPIEAAIADTDKQLRTLAKQMLAAGVLVPNERAGAEFHIAPLPTRGDSVQGAYRARQIAHVFGFRVPDASAEWDEGAWRTFLDQFSGDRAAAGAWEVDFTGTDPDHYLVTWQRNPGEDIGGTWRLASPEFALSDGEADAMNAAAREFVGRGQRAQKAVDKEIQKATAPNADTAAPTKAKRGHAGASAGGKKTAQRKRGESSPSADRYADRVAGDKPAEHAPRSAKGKRGR